MSRSDGLNFLVQRLFRVLFNSRHSPVVPPSPDGYRFLGDVGFRHHQIGTMNCSRPLVQVCCASGTPDCLNQTCRVVSEGITGAAHEKYGWEAGEISVNQSASSEVRIVRKYRGGGFFEDSVPHHAVHAGDGCRTVVQLLTGERAHPIVNHGPVDDQAGIVQGGRPRFKRHCSGETCTAAESMQEQGVPWIV